MIEIKAKTRGDVTELDIHISGDAEEIGLETAYIVTKLPEQLLEKAEPAFHIMRAKTVEMTETLAKEIESRQENTEENNVKCN